mgnify:CR=1 FL=1
MVRTLPATPEAISEAARLLRAGRLVAFPTETVYGLGADAFNALAVARIFEVKNRPTFDPIIVHIADTAQLTELVREVPDTGRRLIEKFWPGPLTLVLPKTEKVPDIVTAGLPTVAVRMPAHPVALALIRAADCPVAAPSANPFGYLSPTTAEHVVAQLDDKVDLILDGGACPVGVESTVLDLTAGVPTVLRPGGLAVEDIEQVIGPVRVATAPSDRPKSPGQLPRHYSPRTPLVIFADGRYPDPAGRRAGLLLLARPSQRPAGFAAVEWLSEAGDLREAAANLFAALHRLDRAGLDIIYAQAVPEVGLGRAIMDRLRKAAAGPVDGS